jgi:hypothetical protein
MADTFEQLWRRLRLYSPTLPAPVAQSFVRNRYRQLLDYPPGGWSFQFARSQFIVRASIFGSADVTEYSNVVSVPAADLPGDDSTLIGRQILFQGRAPVYTIVSNPDTSTIYMDEGYGGVTASGLNYEISDIYFVPPSDFARLISIVDPPNNWQLFFDCHTEELNNLDPQRSSVGMPWMLADIGWDQQYLAKLGATGNGKKADGSPIVDIYGRTQDGAMRPMKELWPRKQTNYVFPYIYIRRTPDLMNDTDKPAGFIRGDAIYEGALADLSAWPGSAEAPNPKYNPVWYNVHEKKFWNLVTEMELIDKSVMERSLTWVVSYTRLRYPPYFYSARFQQSHLGLPIGIGEML